MLKLNFCYNTVSYSPQEVISDVDKMFLFYLKQEERPQTGESKEDSHFLKRKQAAALLTEIFQTRKSISSLIKDAYQDKINFDSTEKFPSFDGLQEFLGKISCFIDEQFNRNPDYYYQKALEQDVPTAALVGRELLESDAINQMHIYLLIKFGNFLTKSYVMQDFS